MFRKNKWNYLCYMRSLFQWDNWRVGKISMWKISMSKNLKRINFIFFDALFLYHEKKPHHFWKKNYSTLKLLLFIEFLWNFWRIFIEKKTFKVFSASFPVHSQCLSNKPFIGFYWSFSSRYIMERLFRLYLTP